MKLKFISLLLFWQFFSLLTFAQTKVLTTDGKTLNASSIATNDDSVVLNIDGETQPIFKANVLAIIPERKKAYTYRVKNGKKQTFKIQDMHSNHTVADKPRMYAYKYMGTDSNASKFYILNADSNMNEEKFKGIFNEQQKKLKTENFVVIGVAVLAFGIGAASLASANSDVNNANNMLNSLQN